MTDQEISQLSLLVTAANLQVNIDILEVSRAILRTNQEHYARMEQLMKEQKDDRHV